MKKLLLFVMFVALFAITACERNHEPDPDPKLEIDKPALEFTREGGTLELKITSNQEWEIVIEDEEWLSASPLKGEGDGTVEFTALAYGQIEERTNTITVKGDTLEKEIPVTQKPADPALDIDKPSLSFRYEGGTDVVAITTNSPWEIVIKEADNWISADLTSGTGDAEVSFTVAAYSGKEDRGATVTVQYGGSGKEIEIEILQASPKTVGLWILSEGDAMRPTAALGYYDFTTGQLKTKVYAEQNGESLGQVANYMGLYGSKLYIAVSGEPNGTSSSVKVLDSETGKLIKNIPMTGGPSHNDGDLARQIAFHGGNAYVTSYFSGGKGDGDPYLYYGGVIKIDTLTLNIEGVVRVGDKPEGIACHGDKLFVCNSSTGLGTTMSIIDINSFTVTNTVTVPQNPTYIRTAPNGDIYFSTPETFFGAVAPSALHKLDPVTYAVTTYDNFRATRFGITDKYIYSGELDWYTFTDTANRFDMETLAVTDIDLAHPMFMLYSMDANPVSGDIYAGSVGDTVIIMTEDGVKLHTLNMTAPYVNQFIPILE